jgi:DNA primase
MYIDFAELKKKVAIEQVVDLLELELDRRGKTWRGHCPHCEGGDDRTLVVTPDKQSYYCFNAKKGGDMLGLVEHILGYGVKDAAFHISDKLLKEEKSTVPQKSQESEEKGKRTLQPLGYLIYEHEDVQAFGLSPSVAEALQVGFTPKGMMRGHVVWPLYKKGVLAGYVGYKDGSLKLPNNLKGVEHGDDS